MKTIRFKDLYLPVKNGLMGKIYEHEVLKDGEKKQSVTVRYFSDAFPCIVLAVENNGQTKSFCYGKTQKEIKELARDINNFYFDPNLFINL